MPPLIPQVPTLLITGANRGIGLELTRQYLHDGWRVVATCRNPEEATELKTLVGGFPERAELHPLSVTKLGEIEMLADRLKGQAMDMVLNNAGVRRMDAFHLGEIAPDAFLNSVEVNALGPLKVAEAFIPHLAAAENPLLVMVSSSLGSIAKNLQGGDYAYRASKAALNAVMRSLAADLKDRGITVVSLHPGWVRTDMGGGEAPLSVEESGKAVREVLAAVQAEDSGRFLRFDGHDEPW